MGRFDLLEVIGRGGAAVVYLALQRDLQRHVALKELAPYHLADTSFAERFVEESRLAGSMNHANIVTVHEFFEDGSVPYIAMEYLPHGSLRQYIGRLSMAQIAGVLEGVLAGLAHGEAHGSCTATSSPRTSWWRVDGRVKIADFGVARAYSKAATRAVVTVAGTTIGTPAYMSPEQALGSDLTPATDLYSLGVVAWELLTGQVPFDETDTPVAVLYRHVHEPVPSVRSVAPDVDEGIADWLEKMLAKRPEDRFQSADEAWVALEDVVLELLGPRWRREARLALDDEEAPRPAHPDPGLLRLGHGSTRRPRTPTRPASRGRRRRGAARRSPVPGTDDLRPVGADPAADRRAGPAPRAQQHHHVPAGPAPSRRRRGPGCGLPRGHAAPPHRGGDRGGDDRRRRGGRGAGESRHARPPWAHQGPDPRAAQQRAAAARQKAASRRCDDRANTQLDDILTSLAAHPRSQPHPAAQREHPDDAGPRRHHGPEGVRAPPRAR